MVDMLTRTDRPLPEVPQASVTPQEPVDPPFLPPADAPGTGPSQPRPARWRTGIAAGAAVLVLSIGGGTVGAAIAERFATVHTTPVTASTVAMAATGAVAETSLAQTVTAVAPSIVTVLVSGAQSSLGSGVILTSDGLILTNNHVVESGGALTVRLADGGTVDAHVIAQDSNADLATLQAEGVSGLTPAILGDDTSLAVGDTVIAFGSPLGLQGTVTAGIVSATNRTIDGESGTYLQTDAAINPGSSGGALVNTAGQVVGINVAIATTGADDGNIGVGFAVPISTVRQALQHLTSGT